MRLKNGTVINRMTFGNTKALFRILIFSTIILSIIPSCTTNKTLGYITSIEQNEKLDSKSLYKDELANKGKNIELDLMEKGRIAQLEGEYNVSSESFHAEVENLKARELDDDTLPGADINLGSVLVNDNMLPYRARLFEVEMLYLYQTFNYLAQGDLEGALVETRLSDFLLNEAEKAREDVNFKDELYRNSESDVQRKLFQNEETIKNALNSKNVSLQEMDVSKKSALQNKRYSSNRAQTLDDTNAKRGEYEDEIQAGYQRSFNAMSDVLGKTKSSVLNPYVIYISGVVHEMGGELHDAYISYKKALQLMPSNPYLRRNVVRLAVKLNKSFDYEWLKSSYPEIWKERYNNSFYENNGRLVVLYESGWIPRKQEVAVRLGAVAIAYPAYNFKWSEPLPMFISSSFGEIGPTFSICYMSALAVRALKEEAKWRIIRQAARVAVKSSAFATGTVMMAASDEENMQLIGAGIMAASAIYNNATENADLRSWMTLPDNVQILDSTLPPGSYNFTFAPKGTELQIKKTVVILENQITVIRVVHVGSRLIFQQLWPGRAN
jgi:uncharacterized protein